jgi:hypothetical protein
MQLFALLLNEQLLKPYGKWFEEFVETAERPREWLRGPFSASTACTGL